MNLKSQAIKLKKLGWKIEDVSKELKISSRTVCRYTEGIPHPNNTHARKPLAPSAKKMSIELAEILGYLASEGSDYDRIDQHLGFDKRRNKAYRRNIKRAIINFSNTDKTVQQHFKKLMKNVFGYYSNFNERGTMHINRVEVVKYIRGFSRFGSLRWKVPKQISQSTKNIKAAFCRVFADGDGTIEMKKREIRIDSKNKEGLEQLQKLFECLKVQSFFYNFNSRYRLVIKDIYRYKEIIGFNHPKKKEKLEILGSK